MFRKASQIGLLLMLLVLSGCQGGAQDENIIDDAPLDRRIGVIKSLGGVITDNQGTHLLQLDDGDTILLKSAAINLDDTKYVNKMVEVRGSMTYAKSGKALMEIQNIDVLDQNYIPKEEEVSAWSLYENSKFGWSIKYKSDFTKEENGSFVSFKKEVTKDEDVDSESDEKDVYTIVVEANEKEDDESLEDYLGLDDEDEASLLADGFKRSRVGTQSLNAYKKQMEGEISFFAEGGDFFYEISFEGESTPDLLAYENVFYEMVTSFSLDNPGVVDMSIEGDGEAMIDNMEVDHDFLGELSEESVSEETDEEPEVVNISVPDSYTSYSSDTFGFSVYYPKSWYFSGTPPTDAGSIRHYDFSDASFEEEDTKGLVSLDVFSGSAVKGSKMIVGDKDVYKDTSGGGVDYYVEVGGRTYKISGGSANSDTMLNMAASIE